jgi:hypothetical protein
MLLSRVSYVSSFGFLLPFEVITTYSPRVYRFRSICHCGKDRPFCEDPAMLVSLKPDPLLERTLHFHFLSSCFIISFFVSRVFKSHRIWKAALSGLYHVWSTHFRYQEVWRQTFSEILHILETSRVWNPVRRSISRMDTTHFDVQHVPEPKYILSY